MAEANHTIKAVAQRTGLTAHVIRVWEKRYRAVEPSRTGTNRRLYSDEEVEKLALLRDLTRAGHSIGAIAPLPFARLRELAARLKTPSGEALPPNETTPLLDQAIVAVKHLDAGKLEEVLNAGALQLGTQGLLQKLIAPLAQVIGDLWRDGTITAAHEHFASSVIRLFLGHAAKSFVAAENAPGVVVGTPNGQLHELGALLVGAAASNLGWHVTYLGPSLPAAEIAGAAMQRKARAVALSIVYPEDDPQLEIELNRLRELLPRAVTLLVGGRAAPSYQGAAERAGAIVMKDLAHLCTTLDQLRKRRSE